MVARRQYVADLEVQDGDLAGQAGPAPGERRGAERGAGVEAAQDVKEQIVGEVTEAVLVRAQPPAASRELRRNPCDWGTN